MSDKNVVVLPIDFSELSQAALPWARRMAAVMDAEIHCIYTVEPPHIYSALDMVPAIPLPTTEELGENAKAQLDAFASEHLGGLDSAPVTSVLTGNPADQVVAYAREVDAEIIIMTTHGYSGLSHVVLGSTTESVLRHAQCPVLSIRNQ
jgi:universal stress protein A